MGLGVLRGFNLNPKSTTDAVVPICARWWKKNILSTRSPDKNNNMFLGAQQTTISHSHGTPNKGLASDQPIGSLWLEFSSRATLDLIKPTILFILSSYKSLRG